MRQDLLNQLSAAADTVPVFRQSAQRVLALAADTQCKPSDLVNTIYQDPILTLKVLKVVNSLHYNLDHKVTSVEHALVHMGMNPIKNLLLPFTSSKQFIEDKISSFDTHQYLVYLLCTAHLAKHIAITIQYADPIECFVAGLLHDFGKLLLSQVAPREFSAALEKSRTTGSLLRNELQSTLQTDYAQVSSHLMEQWKFSAVLVQAVRHQHHDQLQNSDMNICVFAAIQISKHLNFGFSGDNCATPFTDAVQRRLGGTLEQVAASVRKLNPLPDDLKMCVQV